MRTYRDRLVTEATLQMADECSGSIREALERSGHETLATICRKPLVIAAINRAREVASKERFAELARPGCWNPTEQERQALSDLLNVMPGYCCLNDAASIAARL